MLTRRIIPCLDVMNGRTVKGTNFANLQDAGDPVTLGAHYAEEGADELVFLDITATVEKRKTLSDLAKRVSRVINIPFTVGGGIRTVKDAASMLEYGADKISINTRAVDNPEIITAIAGELGSQAVVVAVDVRPHNGEWMVVTHGGRNRTSRRAVDWCLEICERGAGEILLTSMVGDGIKKGFSLDITRRISESVGIPVIASGGAGTPVDFYDVFALGKADAALAASVFHFGILHIVEVKEYLAAAGLPMRLLERKENETEI
jgi:cyclase